MADTLRQQVLRELRQPVPRYPWVKKLKAFLHQCRVRALHWKSTDAYQPERISARPKKSPGNNQPYRILAQYTLEDSLIGSAFAAYTRDLIDPALGPACYAFRPFQNGTLPTHHDAVEHLRHFSASVDRSTALWVAECDIQGFLDSAS
jgi:hypothetical protein